MFSAEMITPFIESFFSKASVMDSYKERIAAARKAIAAADYVLIGAGAGLSAAAGLDYGGMRFKRKFSEFIERYGFTDLYTSSFYDFPTEEERWAYWAKHIDFARFAPPAMELYRDIFRLVDGKEYFVITTNVDGQFRKAGFASDRLFEMQGDYATCNAPVAVIPNDTMMKSWLNKCSVRYMTVVFPRRLYRIARCAAAVWMSICVRIAILSKIPHGTCRQTVILNF